VGRPHRAEGRYEIAFAEDLVDLHSLVRERDAMAPHVNHRILRCVNDISSAVVVTPVPIQALGKRGLIESDPGNESAT
jgi:hypothetical protein